ncbi:hypothetical protein SAMN05421578_101270 [Paenibacillus macquariensis]|uniref:Uncharacterized protein n=1 Tax=Paenibacillus macquariensis TaxID=948756 RepID=A0ABY1JK97_9BACL|nr:hypothetical protein SAMN05421578_101270 [Paenibacillus macquariensis]
MNDDDLRTFVGASPYFISTKSGVSREHLSRWYHNES